MLKNYFKIAIRNLLRNKMYTLINVLGITLGISVALVIYTVLKNETTFDSFHSKASTTYRVVQHNHTAEGTQYWNTTAYPLAEALRQELPQVAVTQAAGPMSAVISTSNHANSVRIEEDKVLFADQHYLSVFDFRGVFADNELWLAGSPATAFAHPNAVILTQSAANRYFSVTATPQDLVGKSLFLNDKDKLVITGIIQDHPLTTSLSFDVLISFDYFKTHNEYQASNWSGNYQGTTFVTLPSQTTKADIEQALATIKKKHLNLQDYKRIEHALQPLSEVHTNTLYGSSPGSYVIGHDILMGLFVMALFIVIVACMNFINLATAHSLKRTRDAGVRKVLGASRKQLFFQYMTEAFLITLTAAIISVSIAEWAISQVNSEISFTQLQFTFDLDLLVFGIAILLAVTLLSGCYPSLVLSKQPPAHVLKGTSTPPKAGFSIRQLLIVFQFSIAQLLIASTIVVASQMHYFRSKDLGYTKDAVLTVSMPASDASKKEVFRQQIKQRPEVEDISLSSGAPTPYGRQYGTSFRLQHEPADKMRKAEMKMADPDYLSVYNLQVLSGNWISEANNVENFNGFVVNETLVRMLGEDPATIIGKHLIINEGEAPVIGVVKDFHNNGLQEEISPCVFLYWNTGFLDEASILLASTANGNNVATALSVIEATWKQVYPDDVFTYQFVDEGLEQHYIAENAMYKAFLFAAGISIFIACLGLYGLVAFVAVQRTKEVGIRKVLGASATHILQLLSWDFIKLVSIAVLLATPIAWYLMHHWLDDFAYRISLEWWFFVGAGLLTMFIALCTVGYQALKTATANPVLSLRNE